MIDSELHILIERYVMGTATAEEREQLLAWYRAKDHSHIAFDELEDVDAVLARILLKTEIAIGIPHVVPQKKPQRWLSTHKAIAVAASICVLLAIGGLGYTYFRKHLQSDSSSLASLSTDIAPGTDQAILRMADGRIIPLGVGGPSGTQSDFFDIVDGYLVLEDRDRSPTDAVIYSTLETPTGGQYKMILSDGTKVSLNAESSIQFPTT